MKLEDEYRVESRFALTPFDDLSEWESISPPLYSPDHAKMFLESESRRFDAQKTLMHRYELRVTTRSVTPWCPMKDTHIVKNLTKGDEEDAEQK